jgi:Post-segregation antitoxin CcdA
MSDDEQPEAVAPIFSKKELTSPSSEKAIAWPLENREAIESSNAYVAKHGQPLAKFRMYRTE